MEFITVITMAAVVVMGRQHPFHPFFPWSVSKYSKRHCLPQKKNGMISESKVVLTKGWWEVSHVTCKWTHVTLTYLCYISQYSLCGFSDPLR